MHVRAHARACVRAKLLKLHLDGEGEERLFNRIQIIGSLKILEIYIWVILLKTSQNCDIDGKNSKCEFF